MDLIRIKIKKKIIRGSLKIYWFLWKMEEAERICATHVSYLE